MEKFQIVRKLGSGGFGNVHLAVATETGERVAIKTLINPLAAASLQREASILKACNHDNIVGVKALVERGGELEGLVLEYMETDLHRLSRDPNLRPRDIKEIMRQILKGLKYLHQNGILHLDIKPSNILVNKEETVTGKTSYKVKLADFGLSSRFGGGNQLPHPNSTMTLGYAPPEVLLGMRDYGPAADVWSAGCVLLELLIGSDKLLAPPENVGLLAFHKIVKLCGKPSEANWPGVSRLPYYKEMAEGSYATQFQGIPDVLKYVCDPDALALVERMLTLDPAKRITAHEALETEYLKEQSEIACWQPLEPRSRTHSEQFGFRPNWLRASNVIKCV